MHLPTTLNIDEKVGKAAIELKDHELISKLSDGDMIAIEALLHLSRLTKLYCKYVAAMKRDAYTRTKTFNHGWNRLH